MVVLRGTDRLLARLKRFDDTRGLRSTTRLGDWIGDLIRMGKRHALLFVSERSALPILMPISAADPLRRAFPEAVCKTLAELGVPAVAIEQERAAMQDTVCGSITRRNHRESVALSAFVARGEFLTSRRDTLDQIARRMAETPVGGVNPRTASRELFGV